MSARGLAGLALASLLAFSGASVCSAADVVINITGNGSDAQFIEDGKTKQLNVVVVVGQTVRWHNGGDRTHTATSDLRDAGTRLFDTGNIAQGADGSITFDQAKYDAAVRLTGSAAGDAVHLGYYCAKHPNLMGGKLVLAPTEAAKRRLEQHND